MFNGRSASKKLSLKERFERITMAVTFAESNLHDSALEMLSEKRLGKRPQRRAESRKDRRPVLMA